jgi:tetratricopeptide (TPR) repeat protein
MYKIISLTNNHLSGFYMNLENIFLLLTHGSYQKAISKLHEFISEVDDNMQDTPEKECLFSTAYLYKGIANYHLCDLGFAKMDFTIAMIRKNDSWNGNTQAIACCYLAEIKIDETKYDEAINYCKKALVLDPDNAEANEIRERAIQYKETKPALDALIAEAVSKFFSGEDLSLF